MTFYVVLFLSIGFIVGMFTREHAKSNAYTIYILISIGWFFVWGPFAIFTLLELAGGDWLARQMKLSFGKSKSIDETECLTKKHNDNIESKELEESKPSPKAEDNQEHHVLAHDNACREMAESVTTLIESRPIFLKILSRIPTNYPASRARFEEIVISISLLSEICNVFTALSKSHAYRDIPSDSVQDMIRSITSQSVDLNFHSQILLDDPVEIFLADLNLSLTEQLEIYCEVLKEETSIFNSMLSLSEHVEKYREIIEKDLSLAYCGFFKSQGKRTELLFATNSEAIKERALQQFELIRKKVAEFNVLTARLNDPEISMQLNTLEKKVLRAIAKIDKVFELTCPDMHPSTCLPLSKDDVLGLDSERVKNTLAEDLLVEIYDNFAEASHSAQQYAQEGIQVKVNVSGEFSIVASAGLQFNFTPSLAKYYYQTVVMGLSVEQIAKESNGNLNATITKAAQLIKNNLLKLEDIKYDFQLRPHDQEVIKQEFKLQLDKYKSTRLKPIYERFKFTMSKINYNDLGLLAAEVQRSVLN